MTSNPHVTSDPVELPFRDLLPPTLPTLVTEWLAEDIPSYDPGGAVVGTSPKVAFLLGKADGVLAGVPFFDEVFKQLGCRVEWHLKEGEPFKKVKHVATVTGLAKSLLQGERTALNILARCSGIATKSRRFRDIAALAGFKGTIAGTRKTTPGFRIVEKYGMLIGGIDPHRHDLSSMVMLKDNHIWSHGSITNAIKLCRSMISFATLIEVEVQNEQEADEAIQAGADIVMLDNMGGSLLGEVVTRLKQRWAGKKFLIEVSGGIDESNLRERLVDGVDILSTSAVHQSVQHIDFSLKIQR
ncbi:nicotinate-nucleotide diphosphorylase [Calocera viscosa TUFC12733]|uniref:Nicotinate-nucleotide pyrophosphorylase [carboxylating] n=1 Tax=Calocera viscosa (strain TUFC12733) TaxID=1330018 RepID=A0A167RJW0_CALVF|nr:nicotinate-nucleotide diphosphorylase [Calocera viscosa TUFC12733]